MTACPGDFELPDPADWTPPSLPWPPAPAEPSQPSQPDQEIEIELPELPLPTGVLGLAAIEAVKLSGRYWFAPYFAYSIDGESITLHGNDDQLPEQWLSLTITAEQLGEMLAAIMHTRGVMEPIAFDRLKSMVSRLPS